MRRLVSCYFVGAGSGDRWPRMARVLEHTARTHCVGWDLAIAALPTPRRRLSDSENHVSNTAKLEHWCTAVYQAADGDELLLIDADTFIVRPIDDIWLEPFDMAYTVRPPDYPMPLNGGVVFVRVSPTTRALMASWRTVNAMMMTSRSLQYAWQRYQGINQRALGYLLETKRDELGQLRGLPCLEWNCEDSAWAWFDPTHTRIVHVKSSLRAAVFGRPNAPTKPHLRALAARWLDLEQQLRGDEAARA